MTPTIEARGLEKRYRRTQALDGLDLVATPSARSLRPHADQLLGHPSTYFVTRALLWTLAILAIAAPLAIAKYRRG